MFITNLLGTSTASSKGKMDSIEVEDSLELEYDMWDGQFDFVGPQEPTPGLRGRVTSDGSLTEDLFTGGPLTPHLSNGINGGKKTVAHQWCDNISDQVKYLGGYITYCLPTYLQQVLILSPEGRDRVRLFWVRAHAGIAGNERVDELAKRAALTKKTAADYDRYPLSYAKSVIRAATLSEWQQRYTEGSTGEITKCFFPRVEQAYRVLSTMAMVPWLAQTLTGHGGFAQYLHRFKLSDSPYCACDPDKIQDVPHVLEECDMHLKERAETEAAIEVEVRKENFSQMITDPLKRQYFLAFCEKAVKRATKYKAIEYLTYCKHLA